MSDIIKATLEELKKHNVAGVDELVLVIGDMTNLGEDQLSFAYDVMTQGTILSGSELVIEHEKIRLKCKTCEYDGPAEILMNDGYDHTIPVLSCPECKGSVNVVEGMACRVRSIKFREG